MKTTTAVARILSSTGTDELKTLKLYSLAFKQMPGSLSQKLVKEEITKLNAGMPKRILLEMPKAL